MPKRISTSHSQDVNQAAFQMVHRLTPNDPTPVLPAHVTSSDVSRVMAAMGRRGSKIGGQMPTDYHDPEQRREVAVKAAKARWDNSLKRKVAD